MKERIKHMYRVINHTTGEILDTDNIAVAYEWAADWEEMGHWVEMIDMKYAEVIVDTKRD